MPKPVDNPRMPRERKYKTMGDIPPDWTPQTLRQPEAPRRRGRLVLPVLGALAVVAAAGAGAGILFWAGAMKPGPAPARDGAPARPAHEAIRAALDSARALMQRSEWSKASTILAAAAAEHPGDQEVRIALAEALLAQRKNAESYEQYEKALAIGPREPKLEFAAGQVAAQAGLTERAIEHFSMVQSADPRNAAAPLMLGMMQRQAGQLDAAKASLLRAANLDPASAFAWGALADIALGENNLGLALQHIGKARQIQPESKEWRLIEARTLARQGEPEKALLVLLPMDPSQRREPAVVRLIAQCHGMLGRHGDAAAAWVEAAAGEPENADVHMEAATALERAGQSAQALEHAKRAEALGHKAAADLVARLEKK